MLTYLKSLFAWRCVRDSGVWLYQENAVTGERRAIRCGGGYQPLDHGWLSAHELVRKHPMALSDCEKCWENPCSCGHQYRNSHVAWLRKQRDMFARLVAEKEAAEQCPAQPREAGDFLTAAQLAAMLAPYGNAPVKLRAVPASGDADPDVTILVAGNVEVCEKSGVSTGYGDLDRVCRLTVVMEDNA